MKKLSLTRSAAIRAGMIVLLVFMAIFSLAVKPFFNTGDIAFYAGVEDKIKVEGVVESDPAILSTKIRLVLRTEKFSYGGVEHDVTGNLLVSLPRYPEYKYGDCLAVTGKIEKTTFGDFAYGDYLAKDNIYAMMSGPWVDVTGRGCGRPEWGVIYEFKNLINNRINVLFTEPAASLVSGLLLGIPRNIPAEVINNFNRTGLTHIVAISGYNITLIISVFGIFLKPFGRRSRFWLSMGGIFIFVILTGMSSSVIRAAIMGALVLVSLISGRRSSGIHSLLISAAVMSLANPRILLFDISFQLSFLATLGILLFMPMVTPYFEKFKKFGRYIFEALAVTLSAQVFTVPLILFRYGLISVIAPLTNLIFLPLVPLIMFFAFLAIIVSVLIPYLTIIISGIAFILCELLIKGVKFFAELPMASLNITSFSIWMMIVYYAAVLIAFILFRRPRSEPDS